MSVKRLVAQGVVLYFLCFGLSIHVYSQSIPVYSIFVDGGIVEHLEKTVDELNVVGSTINLTTPVSIGIRKEKEKLAQIAYYNYQSVLFSNPRWLRKPYNSRHHNSGPHYIHTLGYDIGRELLTIGTKRSLWGYFGISIGYLPENKFDHNNIPIDSSYMATNSWHDTDSNLIFNSVYYDRGLSDIAIGARFSIEYQRSFFNDLHLSVIPTVSWGVLRIWQSDIWYSDMTTSPENLVMLRLSLMVVMLD
ncbi:MAG: hypothetical protein WEC59_12585 [Salibacteraceae bacterium]